MIIPYICHGLPEMKQKQWEGQIKLLQKESPYEAEVTARGCCNLRRSAVADAFSSGRPAVANGC